MFTTSFFGRTNTWLCLFAGFLSAFHPNSQPVPGISAFQQHGKWEILQSNDPMVDTLAHPRIVHILPGRFRIGGGLVFGSFELVDGPEADVDKRKSGVYVRMSLYNLRIFRRVYKVVPTDTDRMALFGAGSNNHDIFYLLQRVKGVGTPTPPHDDAGL